MRTVHRRHKARACFMYSVGVGGSVGGGGSGCACGGCVGCGCGGSGGGGGCGGGGRCGPLAVVGVDMEMDVERWMRRDGCGEMDAERWMRIVGCMLSDGCGE